MDNQTINGKIELAESLSKQSRERQDAAHRAYLATLQERQRDAHQLRRALRSPD